ncbi:TIGR03085 family metal-binding protein [Pseudonocardia sp.]|uniref:TIGR03085 family metal-binding protein n=1 Tax=Pseudonocardia sp. TaxID=60912 RepID=UPI003D10CA89
MSLAVTERAALADTLAAVDPQRHTLCEGWTARDLLAHLLVRERQPWASPGIVVDALAPLTRKAMATWADVPWAEAVALFRDGPPLWSPYRVPGVDALVNGAEHYVHHEDVRRGEPGWEPRPPDATRDAELWAILERTARMLYRRSPVGVVLRRPEGTPIVARPGERAVTISGEPGELLLHGFGRGAIRVEVEGADADVAALAAAPRGF